jgi:hypothetical protein
MQLPTTERDSEPASFYKKMQHNHQLQHYFQQGGAHYVCVAAAGKTAIYN